MNRQRFNVAECGPPNPILVCYPGSGAAASLLAYIVCLHGRVPEKYELCIMNAQGVREVHLFARVRLFDGFTEDTFRTTLYNSLRWRIQFIRQILLNGSVQFIRFSDVTSDSTSNIISTRNMFVHPWGNFSTLIRPTCSNYTCRAYVPIILQRGFIQRYNHERLFLKWVKRKIVAFEREPARVLQDMIDDVTVNYVFPSLNNVLGIASPW